MRINVPSIYYTNLYIGFATEKPYHIEIGCRKGYAWNEGGIIKQKKAGVGNPLQA